MSRFPSSCVDGECSVWIWWVRPGRKCHFNSLLDGNDKVFASLLKAFPETAGWNHNISEVEDPSGAMSVRIIAPPANLSREALLELVDIMMIAAHESGATFDGFNLDLSNLQRRSWQRLW